MSFYTWSYLAKHQLCFLAFQPSRNSNYLLFYSLKKDSSRLNKKAKIELFVLLFSLFFSFSAHLTFQISLQLPSLAQKAQLLQITQAWTWGSPLIKYKLCNIAMNGLQPSPSPLQSIAAKLENERESQRRQALEIASLLWDQKCISCPLPWSARSPSFSHRHQSAW